MTATTVEPTEVTQTEEASTETSPWLMAGTEGTYDYLVLARSSFGRVGYRLVGHRVRIRLEPADEAHAAKIAETLTREAGWKQPGDEGQNRFSIVLPKGEGAIEALKTAFALIKRGRPVRYNPVPPQYKDDLKPSDAEAFLIEVISVVEF